MDVVFISSVSGAFHQFLTQNPKKCAFPPTVVGLGLVAGYITGLSYTLGIYSGNSHPVWPHFASGVT